MSYLPEYADAGVALPPLRTAMAAFQTRYLMTALHRSKGNASRAAAELGIHRNTMERLCQSLAIPKGYGSKKPKRLRKPPLPEEPPRELPTPIVSPRRNVAVPREISRKELHAAVYERDGMTRTEVKKELAWGGAHERTT